VVLQNKEYRPLSFRINGIDLDKADYCLSRYQDGMRSYEVKHPAWGKKAVVRIKAVVGQHENRVVWRIRVANFDGPVQLELPHQQATVKFAEDIYLACNDLTFAFLTVRQGEVLFDRLESDMQEVASTITINTPDKYINPLGSTLSVVQEKVKNVSVEEMLWHFRYDVDQDAMQRLWPSIETYVQSIDDSQLSTPLLAKSYWLNTMAARIAALIQQNGAKYFAKADEAFALLNGQLWMRDKGCWAERKDQDGLQRLHDTPALWSIYTPIDYDACTPEQAYQATKYMDQAIPHIPVTPELSTLATSNWMPYTWDMNKQYTLPNKAANYLQTLGILFPGDKIHIIPEEDIDPNTDGYQGIGGIRFSVEGAPLAEGGRIGPLEITKVTNFDGYVWITGLEIKDAPAMIQQGAYTDWPNETSGGRCGA
jgi:hypothetical protein